MSTWSVRPVPEQELPALATVLQAAARALEERGEPLWSPAALSAAALSRQYPDGQFWLGELETQPVAAMILLSSDLHFWPDASPDTLYLHKLAVHPSVQGQGLSQRMLGAACEEVRRRSLRSLRLDTVQDRPRLRAVYEDFGFVLRGEASVQGYAVALYELEV